MSIGLFYFISFITSQNKVSLPNLTNLNFTNFASTTWVLNVTIISRTSNLFFKMNTLSHTTSGNKSWNYDFFACKKFDTVITQKVTFKSHTEIINLEYNVIIQKQNSPRSTSILDWIEFWAVDSCIFVWIKKFGFVIDRIWVMMIQ